MFDNFKKKPDASKLGMEPEKLQALADAGLIDRESLGLQLDAQGDKKMESAEAGREVAAKDQAKKEAIVNAASAISESGKDGAEDADRIVKAASQSAQDYGSRMANEKSYSLADALEKMKMSKRRA